MLRADSRGGVPVFNRPHRRPSALSDSPSRWSAGSPSRPAGCCSGPIWIRPFRNVPAVTTSAEQSNSRPSTRRTPRTPDSQARTDSAAPTIHEMPGCASRIARTAWRYAFLSACARGDQTAGPRLRFRILNWMPVASIARPIRPPSASISRTRWPLAVPPTAGLQGMCATVSRDSVQSPTRSPSRAAAHAASHPACPAPMTMTSKQVFATAPSPTCRRRTRRRWRPAGRPSYVCQSLPGEHRRPHERQPAPVPLGRQRLQ